MKNHTLLISYYHEEVLIEERPFIAVSFPVIPRLGEEFKLSNKQYDALTQKCIVTKTYSSNPEVYDTWCIYVVEIMYKIKENNAMFIYISLHDDQLQSGFIDYETMLESIKDMITD
jgi:hypothetical protein